MKLLEREIFINAPWGRIAAITWGDPADPPVLLCHGRIDVCTVFRPLVNLLPPCFFYVSVDFPGNGKSDRFPRYSRFMIVDYVATITKVQYHFEWETFAFVGHCMGVIIGKYYNLVYPGHISRMVEIDPIPNFEIWPPGSFGHWYRVFYTQFYSDEGYQKINAEPESAPKYSYEQALNMIKKNRGLRPEAARHILERLLEPAGDGLYRFNYDQRQKDIPRIPLSPDYMKELYTSTKTPTLAILSTAAIDVGLYDTAPFARDEAAWPNRNYKFKIVDGGHDFHINNPELVVDDISKFLLKDFKAKM